MQHDEAFAVFRSAGTSISRTQAVVYLCDILARDRSRAMFSIPRLIAREIFICVPKRR